MGLYDIPSWITNPPNYGESFARGSQVGAAIGRNFLQAKVESDQNARENALLPLRQAILENQKQNLALDIKKGLNDQQDYLLNKEAFVQLSDVAKSISQNAAWADPKSEAAVWDVASKYPSVVSTPQFQAMTKQFDIAGAAALKAKDAQTRAEAANTAADMKGQILDLKSRELDQKSIDSELNRNNQVQIQQLKNEAAMHRQIADGADHFTDAATRRQYSEGVRAIYAKGKLAGTPLDDMLRQSEELKQNLAKGNGPSISSSLSIGDRTSYNALQKEIEGIQSDIAAKQVEMTKNPKKALLDFGTDNRVLEMNDLQEQLKNLQSKADEIVKLSAPKSSAPQNSDETVWVKDPSGRKGKIPKANLDKALKAGYSIYEG